MLAHTCKKSSSEEEKCITAGLTGKLPKRRKKKSSKVNISVQGYILLLYFFTYKIKGHLFKGNSLEGFNCFVHLNEKTLVEKKICINCIARCRPFQRDVQEEQYKYTFGQNSIFSQP